METSDCYRLPSHHLESAFSSDSALGCVENGQTMVSRDP